MPRFGRSHTGELIKCQASVSPGPQLLEPAGPQVKDALQAQQHQRNRSPGGSLASSLGAPPAAGSAAEPGALTWQQSDQVHFPKAYSPPLVAPWWLPGGFPRAIFRTGAPLNIWAGL